MVQSQNATNNNTQKVNNTNSNNQTQQNNNTTQQQNQNVKQQQNKPQAQNTTDTKNNKTIQNNNQTVSKNATQKTGNKEQPQKTNTNQAQNKNKKQENTQQKNQQAQNNNNNNKQENAQQKNQQNQNNNKKQKNEPQKNAQNQNIPKKENGKPERPNEKTKTVEQPKPIEKPFNLTESLINFFQETFGNNTDDKNKNKDLEKKTSVAEMEEIRKRREAEMEQKVIQERERKRREEFEARARAEMIKVENERKEMRKRIEQEQREAFERQLQNMTFDDYVQINLEKGETESLYLDLEAFTKIRLAFILTDEEKRVNFIFSGPNPRGRTSVLYRVDNRNYFYYEYETLRKGEYIIELKNRGSEENELILVLNEKVDKKSDVLGSEKIDKISMLLNTIDGNINQLRNKKKIEIRQINSHNEKVNKNNKSIVIYSIIEIFTMIFVFIAQSYYINSIVTNL